MPRTCLLALAISVTTTASLSASAAAEPDPRGPDRFVLTAIARRADEFGRTFTGLVSARVQSDLGFRIDGKITERLVDVGNIVRRGQPLMRIDPTDFTNADLAQTGSVAAARARWIEASADENRYRGLVATGAVSRSSYDQYKALADSARAELEAAQATQRVSRDRSEYAVLLADADGTIVETLAEPGQYVKDGKPVLRLAHAGPREAAGRSARDGASEPSDQLRAPSSSAGRSRFLRTCDSFRTPRIRAPVPSRPATCSTPPARAPRSARRHGHLAAGRRRSSRCAFHSPPSTTRVMGPASGSWMHPPRGSPTDPCRSATSAATKPS